MPVPQYSQYNCFVHFIILCTMRILTGLREACSTVGCMKGLGAFTAGKPEHKAVYRHLDCHWETKNTAKNPLSAYSNFSQFTPGHQQTVLDLILPVGNDKMRKEVLSPINRTNFPHLKWPPMKESRKVKEHKLSSASDCNEDISGWYMIALFLWLL